MPQTLSTTQPTAASKSERAYTHIRDGILEGTYSPGYRLVLSTIASELDMSVVPVREAIRRLEAEGLVNYERNVGACVRMIDETRYANAMEVLAVLEGVGTAQSAPYLTPKQVGVAEDLNNQMRDLATKLDPVAFTRLNQQFHEALLVASPNTRLVELVTQEWISLSSLRESTFTFVPARAQQSVEEHDFILKLIKDKAPEGAIETAVRSHRMATVGAYLLQQQKGEQTSPNHAVTDPRS